MAILYNKGAGTLYSLVGPGLGVSLKTLVQHEYLLK